MPQEKAWWVDVDTKHKRYCRRTTKLSSSFEVDVDDTQDAPLYYRMTMPPSDNFYAVSAVFTRVLHPALF